MEVHQVADVFDVLADTPAEAADLKARSDLLSALSDWVKAWELPRSAAAKRLGVTPPGLMTHCAASSAGSPAMTWWALRRRPKRGEAAQSLPEHGRVPSPATTLKAACGAAVRLLRKP